MFCRTLSRRRNAAFTLIELLVVIAIIAVLIGLLLPAVQKVREAAARIKCQNNLKQLGIALQAYHDANNALPAGGQTTTPMTSWLVHILPYIEQDPLYQQYNQALPYNNAANLAVGNVQVVIYACPSGTDSLSGNSSEASGGVENFSTHYYGNMGPTGTGLIAYNSMGSGNSTYALDGVLGQDVKVRITDIVDGTSNTLLVAERSQDEPSGVNSYRSWIRGCNGGCGACKNVTNPINSTYYTGANFNDISFGSNHTQGANFALADGGVHFISQSIDMNVYKALASRSGREAASLP